MLNTPPDELLATIESDRVGSVVPIPTEPVPVIKRAVLPAISAPIVLLPLV